MRRVTESRSIWRLEIEEPWFVHSMSQHRKRVSSLVCSLLSFSLPFLQFSLSSLLFSLLQIFRASFFSHSLPVFALLRTKQRHGQTATENREKVSEKKRKRSNEEERGNSGRSQEALPNSRETSEEYRIMRQKVEKNRQENKDLVFWFWCLNCIYKNHRRAKYWANCVKIVLKARNSPNSYV